VIGLIIAVAVTAASVHDNTIGVRLLDKVAKVGTVTKAWVDQGFKNTVVAHGAALGIDVDVVARNPDSTGFVVQPKRWVVEQTNGTLMLERRLVRDYEIEPASSESRVLWAATANMTRRLTNTTTPTWRAA
jgi:transposase